MVIVIMAYVSSYLFSIGRSYDWHWRACNDNRNIYDVRNHNQNHDNDDDDDNGKKFMFNFRYDTETIE